jgi:ferredoxin-type protein NapH
MKGRRHAWTHRRRLVQGSVAAFFLILPATMYVGFDAVSGTLVAFQAGPVAISEPAGVLAAWIVSHHVAAAAIAAAVPLLALALAGGPWFCAWACPWGLCSELIDGGRRGARWPPDGFVGMRRVRGGVLLGLTLVSVGVGAPLAAWLSPPRLMTVLPVEVLWLRAVPWVTGAMLLALLVLELAGPRRLWCRVLCPVGSTWSYLGFARRLRLRFDEARCTCPSTPACQVRCGWAIDPRRMRTTDGCTTCMACIEACPSSALHVTLRTPH